MNDLLERSFAACSGRKVSQTEFAAIWDVTPKCVWDWMTAGLPYQARDGIGEAHVVDTAAGGTWLLRRLRNQMAGGETQRERLDRLRGDALEIELAEKRGALVDMGELQQKIGPLFVATRVRLLDIPGRLAAVLDEQTRLLVADEIADALRDLSTLPETLRRTPEVQS